MAKSIYVADDELHIRNLIQTFLANEGYEVRTFADGDSLFQAFCERCPDLIILDIMMPGTDGLSLCARIRGESRVPIRQGQSAGPGDGNYPGKRRLYGEAVFAAGAGGQG